ncbi:hypothetical protein V5738_04730 [Salinisphaera sp. SPP-AMP-43]|uniref:hypothetical protein n=1 Tax=Salinisphaera sp. SPP-AMP-43 TaxID=3121288 RepID=UPI003C6E5B44
MTTHNWIQILAAIGTLIAVPILYQSLNAGADAIAGVGFVLFAISMLATPVHELKRRITASE